MSPKAHPSLFSLPNPPGGQVHGGLGVRLGVSFGVGQRMTGAPRGIYGTRHSNTGYFADVKMSDAEPPL
jgi:hypothetical protein